MKLSKVLPFLLVFALVLGACAPKATPAPTAAPAAEEPAAAAPTEAPVVKAKSVGIVLPTKNEPRWLQDEARFKDALSKAGYQVEILFSEGDSAKEKANVESLLTKGAQVIVLTPQDSNAAAASADAVRAAGAKIIAYDRLITGSPNVDYYVTFDSVNVGEQMGTFLAENAKGSGLPLYLYAGAASDNNAFLFFEGAWNKLQPKIADGTFVIKNSSEAVALQDKAELTRDEMAKIIGQITTNWDFNTAKSLAESNLTAASDADKGEVFILAPNDGTARAIADAFAADKAVTKFYVTGQDAEKASVQYIIDGKQSMTVLKDVRTLVDDAITAAVAFLEGGTPEKTTTYNNGAIDVPAKPSAVVSVTKDNVQKEIFDSGYWPVDEFDLTNLTAAPAAEAPAVASEPVKIALLAPLTGAVPTFGQSTKEGVELAVKEWNDKGGLLGFPIELIVEDSQCEADPGVNAANKVINQDGVKYIIGEVCSKSSIPISEVANPAKVIQISPTSTNPSVTVGSDGNTKDYIFRACFIDPFQGLVMAKFAAEKGYKTAFVMYDQGNDYTVGLADAFEKSFVELGGQIVGKETYVATDTDFSAILTKAKDSGAEVLYLPDYYNIVNLVGAQAKQIGLTAVMMGGDGWDSSDLDVAAADGGFYSNHYDASDPRPEVKSWLERYGAAYKNEDGTPKVPDALATLGYDAANILFQAILAAGTADTDMVKNAMVEGTFPVVSGTVTYDPSHNPIKNAVVVGVSNGAKTAVGSVAP